MTFLHVFNQPFYETKCFLPDFIQHSVLNGSKIFKSFQEVTKLISVIDLQNIAKNIKQKFASSWLTKSGFVCSASHISSKHNDPSSDVKPLSYKMDNTQLH